MNGLEAAAEAIAEALVDISSTLTDMAADLERLANEKEN